MTWIECVQEILGRAQKEDNPGLGPNSDLDCSAVKDSAIADADEAIKQAKQLNIKMRGVTDTLEELANNCTT